MNRSRWHNFRYSLFIILNSLALADAPSQRELIARGNEHYAAGRYAEALAAYENAGEADAEAPSAELLHNQAAAQFKLGEIDEARELWVRAASLKDAKFEAAARYNLGNCDYADALSAVQGQNVQGALELLDRALAQYRDAVRLDQALANARANLELAQMLKQQIKEQTTTQPQSQPGTTQQQQDQQQSSSQPSSQPNQQDQQSEQGDQQEQQPSSQPSESEQPPPTSQPDSQPAEQQQGPTSQPAEPTTSQPAENQGEEEVQTIPITMTEAEAERLLQMIREAERARRKALARREAARQEPVKRDW